MIFEGASIRLRWQDRLLFFPSRRPVLLLIVASVFLLGAVLRWRTPKLFETRTQIFFDTTQSKREIYPGVFSAQQVNAGDLKRQASELRSREMLAEVVGPGALATRWKVRDEAHALSLLESRITVSTSPAEGTLSIAARDLSPAHSAALANVIATRYVHKKKREAQVEATSRIQRLETERAGAIRTSEEIESRLIALGKVKEQKDPKEVEDLRGRLVMQRNLLHSLDAKLQLARIEAEDVPSPARVVEAASPYHSMVVLPFYLRTTSIGFAAILAGVLTILLGGSRKSPAVLATDFMQRLDLPYVGFAPLLHTSLLPSDEAPGDDLETYRAYRDLRNRLLRLPTGQCCVLTLLQTGAADPQVEGIVNLACVLARRRAIPAELSERVEGIVNLACVLADAGRSTLVIDANLRNATLHECFDSAQHPGLSDYLSSEMELEETIIQSRRSNLWFLPAGPELPDPGNLLSGRGMTDLIWELRRRFDFVLLAAPAMEEGADAALLSSLSDCSVALSPMQRQSEKQIREMKSALIAMSSSLWGVLFLLESTNSGGEESDLQNSSHKTLLPRNLSGARGAFVSAMEKCAVLCENALASWRERRLRSEEKMSDLDSELPLDLARKDPPPFPIPQDIVETIEKIADEEEDGDTVVDFSEDECVDGTLDASENFSQKREPAQVVESVPAPWSKSR